VRVINFRIIIIIIIRRFVKGVHHFDATFEVQGLVTVSPNIYVPLDRGMSVLQLCCWKSSLKETL